MPVDPRIYELADQDIKSRALGNTVQGLDEDKDKASLSMDIGNASGADPWMVYKNYDEFARNRKANISQELVDKDPWLTSYVNSHPLAGAVSKDDWANLSHISDTLKNNPSIGNGLLYPSQDVAYTIDAFKQGLDDIWSGLHLGFDQELPEQPKWMPGAIQRLNKVLAQAAQSDVALTKIFMGALSALGAPVSGVVEGEISQPLEKQTGIPAEYTDAALTLLGLGHGIISHYKTISAAEASAKLDRIKDTVAKSQIFLGSRENIPVGVDPAIDQLNGLDSKNKMAILDAIMDADKKSETRELSPELFNKLTKLQHPNQNIYVRWNAAKALYGEELPAEDDGKLGWVKGIQDQFKDSAVTGRDIEIPLADWRAKVDPEINKLLHDDLLFQDGMTLNEVKELPTGEPIVSQVHEESFQGLSEDIRRPFTLKQTKPGEFEVRNEAGARTSQVKVAETDGGKTLIVQWDGSRDIAGLKTVLDQLKEKYPQAEEITGPKIPGMIALERALGDGSKIAVDMPFRFRESAIDTVRRSGGLEPLFSEAPAGWDVAQTLPEARDLEAEGYIHVANDLWARPQIMEELTTHQRELNEAIGQVLRRILGREAPLEIIPAHDIRVGKSQRPTRGVFQLHANRIPTLIWSLGTDRPGVDYEPLVTARHEAVHFLREYGYLTDREWKVLTEAALKKDAKGESWIDKHQINERYWNWENEMRIEEAIVHEFSYWDSGRVEATGALGRIFQKIRDIRDGIRDAIRQVLGHDLTAEDIFARIERGAVARRGPAGMPRTKGAFPVKLEEEPLIKPLAEEGPTFPPGSLLPKETYSKYMRAINSQHEADIKKMIGDAEREQKKQQTPEWKSNYLKMRSQVIQDIGNRPDFLVSAFFRTGKWFGTDTHWMPKIDPKFLTKEDKAGLPSRFLNKGGLNPDDIAGDFGYQSGRALVDDMVRWESQRADLQPAQFFEKMVKEETERRMEQKYGRLSENIAREAREHVVSSAQFEILHQEAIRLAQLAGQAPPMDKAEFLRQADLRFRDKIGSKVSLQGLFRDLGKAGRDAEKAFFAKDYATAFTAKMQQVHILAESKLLKEFEKQKDRLDSDLKMHRKQTTLGTPNEFSEWIHDIGFRIGRPPQRSIQNLQDMISKRLDKTLRDFYNTKNSIGMPEGMQDYEVDFNPGMPIADFLMDNDPRTGAPWRKNLDDMTVGEYKAVASSIRALVKIGRDEGKVLKEGEIADLEKVKSSLISKLEVLGIKKQYAPGKEPGFWRTSNASLIQMEALFNRLDHGDESGEFKRMFTFPWARAEGLFHRDVTRTSKAMLAINKKYKTNMKEKIENDVFYEPRAMTKDANGKPVIPAGGKEWLPMTRANLRAVLLNMGNESNLKRLAEGYHTTPEKIIAWADQHATKEDWGWAHDIGHEIFDKIIQTEADKMTMSMSDVVVDRLPLGKVQTAAAGELDGWYYPIVYDRSRGGGPQKGIERAPPTRIVTDKGWQNRRTGSAGPVNLSINPLTTQIIRRLRDNHFREVIHNSQKILMDKEFKGAFGRYVGQEYANLIEPYLRDIAGISGYTSAAEKAMESTFEGIRRRTISTMVGWKIGTVLKHGPTAFFQSLHEMGIFQPDVYRATGALFANNPHTLEANWKFMMHGGKIGDLDWGGSTELQRRGTHWDETVGAATDITLGKTKFADRMQSWGSKPVAWSDMMSSALLWWAKYDKEMKENTHLPIEQAHTRAVDLADYAVRRTHGSTSITSRPELMRRTGAWNRSVTSLYGFFNHIYNRFYEMAWMSKEAGQKGLRGEYREAAKDVYKITSDAMFYVALPGFIEQLAQNWLLQSDKEEDETDPWKFMAEGTMHSIAGSIPLARDVWWAVSKGRDPAIGIFSTPYQTFNNIIRDMTANDLKPGELLHQGVNLAGITTGLGTDQLGRWLKLMYNITAGEDNPETPEEWYRGIRTGSSQKPRR